MYFWILALAGASFLFGADDLRLAQANKAQADFDRVQAVAAPQLRDASECAQSQAAYLAVVPPQDAAFIHLRKGYCSLAVAMTTGGKAGFAEAAQEFDRALENWPAHARFVARNAPPPAVPASWRVAAVVAHLQADSIRLPEPVQPIVAKPPEDEEEPPKAPPVKRAPDRMDRATVDQHRATLSMALTGAGCSDSSMPVPFCLAVLNAGRRWLGWIALDRENLDAAAREFSAAGSAGWAAWVAGRGAASAGRYAEASAQYRKAVEGWAADSRQPVTSFAQKLGPAEDLSTAYAELGGAELLAGNAPSAIASLDEAIRRDPADAHAIYLRAVAREKAGDKEHAFADYSLASRTAFANATDMASGEAHLYRGMLLYERKDFTRAEAEFSSALNFEIPKPLAADASAWRHLAAVTSGACGSIEFLARALAHVSPYFPRETARSAMASCPASAAQSAAAVMDR